MHGTGSFGSRVSSRIYKPVRPIADGEVRWPVDGKSLQALVDLGMSDQRIAEYFRVPVSNVTEMKIRYAAMPQSAIR